MSLLYKPSAGGGGPTVVDDFEDGDIAEYAGDTAPYSVQSTTVLNGSNALEVTGISNFNTITDTDELPHPGQGDTFRWHMRNTSSSGGALAGLWAVQSETGESSLSSYGGVMAIFAGELRLVEYSNGSATQLATTAVNWSANEWYEFEVQWATDGSMTLTAWDSTGTQVGQVSATDTTYTSGGIGWRANEGSTSESGFYDYMRVV